MENIYGKERFVTQKKTIKEIEEIADRLLRADKPKLIVADLTNEKELTEQQVKHFQTAEYIWNLQPQTTDGQYKGKFIGLLLDESLNYVHIVFASKNFLDYLWKLKGDTEFPVNL